MPITVVTTHPRVTHAPGKPSHSSPPSTLSVCPVTYPLCNTQKHDVSTIAYTGGNKDERTDCIAKKQIAPAIS
jgi:hypothetical protein